MWRWIVNGQLDTVFNQLYLELKREMAVAPVLEMRVADIVQRGLGTPSY